MDTTRACAARTYAIVLACVLFTGITAAAASESDQPSETGTVVATITTLEGQVRMPGVVVELRGASDPLVLGQTTTDGAGQVTFPDVPPGRYILNAAREGFFARQSPPFDVRSNARAEVLLDIQLTFALPTVEVQAATTPSPTDSVQPVSMSDLLAGSVMELAPIQGDDFQSLLPLLPGVVRGNDGRLRIKGGQPTQGALQIAAASLVDPSTGDFDLATAQPEHRVGGSAGQSFCGRIRPVHDERDANPHAPGHERVGVQARQPDAAVSQKLHHPRIRAADVGARPIEARSGSSWPRTSSFATWPLRSRACPTNPTSN